MKAAGRTRIDTVLTKKAPRMHARLADRIWAALGEHTVVVPGTAAVEAILPDRAAALAALLDQRTTIAARVEKVLDDHPLAEVLTSMPGIGVRTAARILVEVGDASSFPPAGHLASYAGLAPVTRRSGTSIKGEHPARGGNKRLKNALFGVRVLLPVRPRITRLLRPETRREEEAQRRPDLPGPPPR